MDIELSSEVKTWLLTQARSCLGHYLSFGKIPSLDGLPTDPVLQENRGVFVTLTQRKTHQLRGCIGTLQTQDPLWKSVMLYVIYAALNDTRFVPVTPPELPHLRIEISVLSPFLPISSYTDIVLGKHGILFEKSGKRAVFLPHVPLEHGWTLTETLDQLALKAGLHKEAWKDHSQFKVFESLYFSETL